MNPLLPSIPLLYRVLFLWIEPLMAFNGALLCIFNAPTFLRTFSASAVYTPDSQVMYDQLAATYFLFAFNQAVVLRIAKDLKVWKAILCGILICDTFHLFAAWRVMGTDDFLNPFIWRAEEWVNFLALYVPGSIRIAFIFGVGFKSRAAEKRA